MRANSKHAKKWILIALAIVLASVLCGCNGGAPAAEPSPASEEQTADDAKAGCSDAPAASANLPFPSYHEAVFNEEAAVGEDAVKLDLSSANKGYFGLHAVSDAHLKLQVKKEGKEEAYVYDVVNDHTDFFPFQDGDGHYQIRVMQNVEGNRYFELFASSADVTLENDFAPFLIPCQYASYHKDSACVEQAGELAAKAKDEKDFVEQVFDFVCSTISYDTEKAKTVQTGYIPDPDETLQSGKGICFDYAALTASMLRCQGIPTKIIFGYVDPDQIYHAWNMFYTDEDGWTSVQFQATPNKWNRLDVTFLANGSDSRFTGDGTNYTDVYQY